MISCRILENAVWLVICSLLLEPATLISALEGDLLGEQNTQIANQIGFIVGQIREKQQEDERLYRAYVAGAFDETEYAERRSLIRGQSQRLAQELEKLQPQVMTATEFEERKRYILEFSKRIQREGVVVDAPYEIKKQILKMLVDRIVLNVREGWFRIEGVFPGIYAIRSDDDNTPTSGFGSIVTPHSAAAIRCRLPRSKQAKSCSTWAAAVALTASWRRGRSARAAM